MWGKHIPGPRRAESSRSGERGSSRRSELGGPKTVTVPSDIRVQSLPSLPLSRPRGPQHTVPGRVEGQTPSGRWGSLATSGGRGGWQSPHSLPKPGLGWWWLLSAERASTPGSQERRFWQGTGQGGAESGDQGSGASSRRVEPRPDRPRALLPAWCPQGAGISAPPAAELRPPSPRAPPLTKLAARPAPRPPGKPSPSGLTDTSSAQSKVAVHLRAPLGSAFASSGPGSRGAELWTLGL